MATFMERNDAALGRQVSNFTNKIDGYAALLGLDAGKIALLKMHCAFFLFVLQASEDAREYALSYTAYKNHVRHGLNGVAIGPVPVPPVYDTPPPPVPTGSLQTVFGELIQDCVRSKNFTPAIAQDLAVLKPAEAFNPEDGTPELFVTTARGGHPVLRARIGGYEGYSVYKDSGDGKGYTLIGASLHPDFLDTSALPAQGAFANWKYKVIYMYQNAQAGNWSNEVPVTVYGSI